jgi:hypothetical protein
MDHRLSIAPANPCVKTDRRSNFAGPLPAVLLAAALNALAGNVLAQEIRDSLGKPLGPLTSSIARENEFAERQFNLLARVEISPDEVLEFYEPSPGLLVISGAGTPAALSVAGKMPRSPADAWRRATAGAEIPRALRQALERKEKREAARQIDSPRISARWGGGSPARNFTRAAGYCDGAYHDEYGGCGSGYDFMVCLNDWWDGAYAYHHDTDFLWTQVCPATGRVVLRIRSNEIDGGVWTVDQHTVRYFSFHTNCTSPFDDCPYIRADVEQATGVRFHFEFLAMAE